MTVEFETNEPREDLPEFKVYRGSKFVPRRLCAELPIFGYSRISIAGEENSFFRVQRELRQDDEEVYSVSAIPFGTLWPFRFVKGGHSFTLEINKAKNGFQVTESLKVEDNFFGNLWILGENEIEKVADQRYVLRFENGIVLFPAIFDVHGKEEGIILAEKKNVLPESLGEEFLGELVKGLVGLPVKQERRNLPAVYANSDEALVRGRSKPRRTPWVRLEKPGSFYVHGRRMVRG